MVAEYLERVYFYVIPVYSWVAVSAGLHRQLPICLHFLKKCQNPKNISSDGGGSSFYDLV